MYKHVSLRKRHVDGRSTWTLVGPDGQPIQAFDAFAHALRRGPKNTLDAYCRHLAEFIDYLIEVCAIVAVGRQLTKLELTEAIEGYSDYLRMGVDATSEIARAVAAHRPPGKNSATSLVPKKAAVRRFLRLSEDIRQELAEQARVAGKDGAPVDTDPLFPGLGERRALQAHEVRAMKTNSMLAGVIAGGPKFIDSIVLDGNVGIAEYDARRAFPYDKVMDLIDAMPTYRDKTEYALLAASGGRTSEVLQILKEDIDVVEGSVLLVDPNSRPGHPSYRALSPDERRCLSWKGRTTQLTLLIEPFASAFFDSLQKYLEHEHIAHGRHDFLFQYSVNGDPARPYFLSSSSSRLEIFDRACSRVGVVLPPGTHESHRSTFTRCTDKQRHRASLTSPALSEIIDCRISSHSRDATAASASSSARQTP